MKSSKKKLNDRGLLDQDMVIVYKDYNKEELILLLDEVPSIRTIAIHLLSLNYHSDIDYTDTLLKHLANEKALYTRIEIQNNLSKYGHPSEMCQYLGLIGNNQYKKIPNRGSLKKSYPLPRDIIARSLAHMNITRFKEFFCCLLTLPYNQLLEGIDALGFICFYNKELATHEVYCFIKDLITQFENNSLMTWKLITCLSAFPQSDTLLHTLKVTQKNSTLISEVERSIQCIKNSNN